MKMHHLSKLGRKCQNTCGCGEGVICAHLRVVMTGSATGITGTESAISTGRTSSCKAYVGIPLVALHKRYIRILVALHKPYSYIGILAWPYIRLI